MTCEKCGAFIDRDKKFCTGCGAPIPSGAQDAPKGGTPKGGAPKDDTPFFAVPKKTKKSAKGEAAAKKPASGGAPEKKKFWLSRAFIFGASGAAVLACVIIVILASLPSGGASAPEKQLAAFQRGGEVIITRGEKILHTLPGILSYIQHDTSRETMAL
ncbi:MAG: hypothetical protein LBR85_09170, partial [Oscillospiraceae bacterium]|nr:hypothetical protein [Oscillospiraceae bacterium]